MNELLAVVKKHWGYDTLRPMQAEAMAAAVERRDSLAVLPTGGGKSLCYQAPALLSDKLTVVVSPLIALMKDQVDQLLRRGIPAAFLNSSLEADDRRRVAAGICNREYRLIFVAPERFAHEAFLDLLDRADVGAFAIDEAHCISHWGHDFRGDYRQLGLLKRRFSEASVHAFTATATPRVRSDIVEQLGLTDPRVLVGDFFRPNLAYRVQRRSGGGFRSIIDAVEQREGNAGIVYCIRRLDVDELALSLRSKGIAAQGYHAGLDDEERTRIQDDFASRKTDVIVATVAFGMGIDRSDIRYVIHAAMPKSIEHYQQETGRAGRDGQPAECLLFYSGADYHTWQTILAKGEGGCSPDAAHLLSEMYNYCTSVTCRHRRLVTYFGQAWDRTNCGACDVCGGEFTALPDSTELAQKILSCIARVDQRFGAGHVADVLIGASTEKISARRHNELSTYALLSDHPRTAVMRWIDQLVDQDAARREGEYRILTITPHGWDILRGSGQATLSDITSKDVRKSKPNRRKGKQTPAAAPGPLDIESKALYQHLRALRKRIAEEMNVPAFFVFSDKTLREMARQRPASELDMLKIKGVGRDKHKRFGQRFLRLIAEQ